MPELPEVMVVADQLKDKMCGKKLKNLNILINSRYYPHGIQGKEYLESFIDIDNDKIIYNFDGIINNVYNRGKTIIIEVYDNNSNRVYLLISHMKMNGRWSFDKCTHPSIILEICKLVGKLGMDGDSEFIYFEDSDKKAYFKCICTKEDYDIAMRDIGEEYINITYDKFRKKIYSYRLNKTTISAFLLNQKWFSGIGNYLKSEILYVSKISPHRLIHSLTEQNVKDLFDNIKYIIKESYNNKGCTLYTFIHPDGNKGGYIPKVYGRKYDDLGNKITVDIIDERITYWVKNIQE